MNLGNFKDHDDANIIFHSQTARWVDMQIMYQKWDKRYCDNVHGYRRTVSVRTSTDGLSGKVSFKKSLAFFYLYFQVFNASRRIVVDRYTKEFTDDWGCTEHPQTSEHCKEYNLTNMIIPNKEDPPELEFYRIRPFYLETSINAIQVC